MVAALLFWCEGGKRRLSTLTFINSDPSMIKTFLRALRKGFSLDERKFSITLHLHEYHSMVKQTEFWSVTTGIPGARFTQPYMKPHTGKRKREGYQGCISLNYHDARLARTLSALYHSFAERMGA